MPTTTSAQFTGRELFPLLRPEQVHALSEVAERLSLKKGEIVYNRGDAAMHLYVVIDGQVSLRMRRTDGASLVIDEAGKGEIFGYCVCLDLHTYSTTAICSKDSTLLKIDATSLKKLMDRDLMTGYAVQTLISRVYFRRYLETMKKLQAIVQSIPLT
jgi:CRP-like cAMP-binding protein